MAENKIQPHDGDLHAFLESVEPEKRRADGLILLKMMQEITGMSPKMWGENMVGFGKYHYKYKSGREGDYLLTGFSPRKAAMSIYIMPGFKRYGDLLEKLGKHKHSVSCLYVTRLENIDLDILAELVRQSVADMKDIYPEWWP